MSEQQMMWVIALITPFALWVTVPSYIEELRQGPTVPVQVAR